MKLISKLTISILTILFVMTGCTPALLKYQLDPGFDAVKEAAGTAKIVAVSVVDLRKNNERSTLNGKIAINGIEADAKVLQAKLIEKLKRENYKIISKPLLADIAFEIEINKLSLLIESGTFKSVIQGQSEFKLTVNKHSERWSKIFRATRTQEVANPANNLDATGVINQMLTKQLATAFSDPALADFVSKEP